MKSNEKKQAFNPYLPSYEYIPDGEPRIFGSRLYVYGSHDRFNGMTYCMNDYVCWSAPTDDLGNWRYEGVIYKRTQDSLYDGGTRFMFAPDVVRGIDGRYYLYYTLDVSGFTSVAVCDAPAGKYEFYGHVCYPDGEKLGSKRGDAFQFDPGVLIDGGKVYLYTGFGCIPGTKFESLAKVKVLDGAYCYELCPDMLTVKGEGRRVIPAKIAPDTGSFVGHEFYEASSPRKLNGRYYLVYSSALSHELCYAVSAQPDTGFTFGGTLVSNGDIGYDGRAERDALNYTGNNHGGLTELDGKLCIFYHRHTNGISFSRQGCADVVQMHKDGSIAQTEMTSCGLNFAPLKGRGVYPSYIACNLFSAHGAGFYGEGDFSSHPYITQSGEDRESGENQHIANMRDGSVAGFKYFDLSQTCDISVEVRGDAGKFLVFSDNDTLLCEISVAKEKDFTSFSAKISTEALHSLSDKINRAALFFRFEGDGAADFNSFTLC